MRTSLKEIKLIDDFFAKRLNVEEKEPFRIRMSTDSNFYLNVYLQKKIYNLIEMYHHLKLKHELDVLHRDLLTDPGMRQWRKEIDTIFA